MKIEIIKNQVFVDGALWGKKWKGDVGDQIINLLFYKNRDGSKDYQLLVNGVDETQSFKDQVRERYQNIMNVGLRNDFFKYANVYESAS